MKKLLLISLIFTCFSANAQLGQGYNAKYRPLTFEDYMRPAMIYDQARSKEVDRFDNYMDKLSEQCSSDYPNYGLIKFYSNRCLEINNSRMFNGELCDNGVLYYLRGVSQIELGERQEGINDLRKASQHGYRPAQEFLNQYIDMPNSTVSVRDSRSKTTLITNVNVQENYTSITITSYGFREGYAWCSINPNTYIVANGQKLKMSSAGGIALSPNVTYYNSKPVTFTLYFPKLPSGYYTTIDLIESENSAWRFYGIKIR